MVIVLKFIKILKSWIKFKCQGTVWKEYLILEQSWKCLSFLPFLHLALWSDPQGMKFNYNFSKEQEERENIF